MMKFIYSPGNSILSPNKADCKKKFKKTPQCQKSYNVYKNKCSKKKTLFLFSLKFKLRPLN